MVEEGLVVESLLAYNPLLINEVLCQMQGWYKEASKLLLLPSRFTVARIKAERVALCT